MRGGALGRMKIELRRLATNARWGFGAESPIFEGTARWPFLSTGPGIYTTTDYSTLGVRKVGSTSQRDGHCDELQFSLTDFSALCQPISRRRRPGYAGRSPCKSVEVAS
jgi:hypothetical protein